MKRTKFQYSDYYFGICKNDVGHCPGFKVSLKDCLDFPLQRTPKTMRTFVVCKFSFMTVR